MDRLLASADVFLEISATDNWTTGARPGRIATKISALIVAGHKASCPVPTRRRRRRGRADDVGPCRHDRHREKPQRVGSSANDIRAACSG